MQGVTTAIVAFLLVCIVFPSLVKNRPQYYGALAMMVLVILLDGFGNMADAAGGFRKFVYLMTALLQVGALLVLFLAAGGLSPRELAKDMARAYEVIRRGEEEKEIIIPRTGAVPTEKEEVKPERIELEPDPKEKGGGGSGQ